MKSIALIPNKKASDFENELEMLEIDIINSTQNITFTHYEFEVEENKIIDLETLITIFQC
jgi:hypothetical protein